MRTLWVAGDEQNENCTTPRFQSAIHDHPIWANILPLTGTEKNIIFEEDKSRGGEVVDGGNKVNVVKEVVVHPGEILKLPADAIHCIENTSDFPARSLHVYGGNFKTIDHERTLWSWVTKEKVSAGYTFTRHVIVI